MSCLLALGRLSDNRYRGLVLWAWVSVKSSCLELVFYDQVQHIRSESTSNTHYGARLETVQLHWRSIGFHTLKLLCWNFQAVVLDTVCYSLLETIGLLMRQNQQDRLWVDCSRTLWSAMVEWKRACCENVFCISAAVIIVAVGIVVTKFITLLDKMNRFWFLLVHVVALSMSERRRGSRPSIGPRWRWTTLIETTVELLSVRRTRTLFFLVWPVSTNVLALLFHLSKIILHW